jgi:hypothetical protein
MCFVIALVGLAISFALPTVARREGDVWKIRRNTAHGAGNPFGTNFSLKRQKQPLAACPTIRSSSAPKNEPVHKQIYYFFPRDEGVANGGERKRLEMKSLVLAHLLFAVQELDPCIADCRLCFVCFDKAEEMHLA